MSSTMQVDTLAEKIKTPTKATFLTSVFKNGLKKKLSHLNVGCISVVDGEDKFSFGDTDSELQVNVQIHSQEFYVMTGSGGAMGIAEAYILGYWTSDDVVMLMRIILKNRSILLSLNDGFAKILNPINKLIHRSRQNTLKGSKENILAHYDLSNDFYKLWLDPTMTYSCGYFNDPDTTLEAASIEKLDRICRKLKLSEKDNILEIGTGWGSFSIHAAKNYGCSITTTTISDAQYEYAKARVVEEGLESKINVINKDYRKLDGQYDKIVSIEMLEAVGQKYYGTFFNKCNNLLKPHGKLILQVITIPDQRFQSYKKNPDWIQKHIFPGGMLPSLSLLQISFYQS